MPNNNEPNEKPKSNRGGKRPGAGAPKGNLNALKHGRRSRQLEKLSATLAANPETRDALLKYTRAMDKRQANELEDAGRMLFDLLDHARKIAIGEYSPGPFQSLLKEPAAGTRHVVSPAAAGVERLNGNSTSMKDQQSAEKAPRTQRPSTRTQHRATKKVPINQTADTNATNNQTPDTKTPRKSID